ncbi:type II secretion system GspH family protein [bacterium]|nr:type II secretion system GspH family protein [bacterium]
MSLNIKSGLHEVKEPNDTPVLGFTLMELLVTLTLFSAIMGILLTSFFQFHQQGRRMESITRLRQEARILERIIRTDIQSVVYLDQFMTDPQNTSDLRKSGVYGIDEKSGENDADKLYLHVNNTSRFQRSLNFEADPEIHEVGYLLEEDENQRYLFKRREEFYIDPDITEGERSITHTLSQNLISFNVQYYKGTEEEPLDEWDASKFEQTKNSEDKLPTGILVSLTLKSDDGEEYKTDLQINIRPYMGNGVTWR